MWKLNKAAQNLNQLLEYVQYAGQIERLSLLTVDYLEKLIKNIWWRLLTVHLGQANKGKESGKEEAVGLHLAYDWREEGIEIEG